MPKFAIVTGGNTGIGFETVKELIKLGYHVTITARSEQKVDEARQALQQEIPGAQIDSLIMELKDLSSVTEAALQYLSTNKPLDLLINNAGIMGVPYERTKDGFESQFQVNHLGHFLFTHYLLPLLQKTASSTEGLGSARVVNLSSRAHMRWSQPFDPILTPVESPSTYEPMTVYGRSKLFNIYFTKSLAKRFPYDGKKNPVTFNALHPGLVDTKLLTKAGFSSSLTSQAIPVSDGCKCSLYVATSPEIEGISGEYFHDSQIARDSSLVSGIANNEEEAEKLWQLSLRLVNLTDESYGISP